MATQPSTQTALGRVRSYGYFLVAGIVYFFLLAASQGAANFLHNTSLRYLFSRSLLLLMELLVFGGMAYAFQAQHHPIAAMGLPRRKGMVREFLLGLAIGWAMIVVCMVPLALVGGIVFSVDLSPSAWGLLLLNLAVFLVSGLQEEVAFRGYPFQRLVDAMNPVAASIVMALVFGLAHMRNPGATVTSFLVTCLSALLFSIAYLRTRALWLAWGIHFAWNASMALLFGLPVSGLNNFSSVLTGMAMGPGWLTGGAYGVEGSWLGVFVMLGGIVVVLMATRELNFQYNVPVIIPGGMPVDLDAAARRQHEAAQAHQEQKPQPLVQIAPLAASAAQPPAEPVLAGAEHGEAIAVKAEAAAEVQDEFISEEGPTSRLHYDDSPINSRNSRHE